MLKTCPPRFVMTSPKACIVEPKLSDFLAHSLGAMGQKSPGKSGRVTDIQE